MGENRQALGLIGAGTLTAVAVGGLLTWAGLDGGPFVQLAAAGFGALGTFLTQQRREPNLGDGGTDGQPVGGEQPAK